MPTSVQRVLAAVGMVVVGAGAGLLAFVSVSVRALCVREHGARREPVRVRRTLAAAGLATAIIGVFALATGSRAWTRRAAIPQAVCALALTVLFEAIGAYGIDPLLLGGLLTVIAVDGLAVWAAVRPRPEEAPARARREVYGTWAVAQNRMPVGSPAQISFATMVAIAATGLLAVVIEYALGSPFNL